jgi:UDP-N-acetylglucosamine 2-epimerase
MKTILINPSQNTKYPQPLLGLASIAVVLEQKGHQVEIIDANVLQLFERVQYVTLRNNTERPETVEVGANVLAGTDSGRILDVQRRCLLRGKDGRIRLEMGRRQKK